MSTDTSVAIVVDGLEFRRACFASLLGEWATTEEITLLPLSPEDAHQRLRGEMQCSVVILNAGATALSLPDVLSEIKVLRALAPAAALVLVADREDPDDVLAAMQAGAQAYVSNLLSPDLVFRVLSFVLHGGTYFPRSIVDKGSFPGEPELEATPARREEASEMSGPVSASAAAADVAEATTDDATRLKRLLDFSNRQMAILAGICRGEPNKIIGRTLNLPESTVKVHVREIMRKLAVSNRTQVAIAFSRLSQPISAVPSSVRKAVDPPAGTVPGNALVCDVITLVPSPGAKVVNGDDDHAGAVNLTSGRFSRTR